MAISRVRYSCSSISRKSSWVLDSTIKNSMIRTCTAKAWNRLRNRQWNNLIIDSLTVKGRWWILTRVSQTWERQERSRDLTKYGRSTQGKTPWVMTHQRSRPIRTWLIEQWQVTWWIWNCSTSTTNMPKRSRIEVQKLVEMVVVVVEPRLWRSLRVLLRGLNLERWCLTRATWRRKLSRALPANSTMTSSRTMPTSKPSCWCSTRWSRSSRSGSWRIGSKRTLTLSMSAHLSGGRQPTMARLRTMHLKRTSLRGSQISLRQTILWIGVISRIS